MKKQIIFYILLICILLFTLPIYATDTGNTGDTSDTSNPGGNEPTTFSDFSNVTVTTVAKETEDSVTHVYRTILNITGITGYDSNSNYSIGLSHNSNTNISDIYFDTNVKTTTNGTLSFEVPLLAKYFEEAGDVYLWVLETKGLETKVVLEAYKLERVELPTLGKRLYASFLQLNTTMYMYTDHYTGNERTISYKIGLINDSSIINKFKNSDTTALSSLLQYAKTATAIKTGTAPLLDSDSITSTLDITDGAYYYVYLELEDENGKYYPVEDVWLYQGQNIALGKDLINYGTDEFYWTEDEQKQPSQTDDEDIKQQSKDDTTMDGKLPQTGINTTVYILITILIVLVVISYLQYKRYKDIKK